MEGALEAYRAAGHEIVGAVMAGGTEKIGPEGITSIGGTEVRALRRSESGPRRGNHGAEARVDSGSLR